MPRPCSRILATLFTLFLLSKGYSQGLSPGCKAPYYRGNYGPPLDGSVILMSTAVAPDASVYVGATNYPDYSILKLDSFGNMIRYTSYPPPPLTDVAGRGKTIVDYDGKLFSAMKDTYVFRTDTTGNVLSTGKHFIDALGNFFQLQGLEMLANGDKVFVYMTNPSASRSIVMVTSPDGSVIRWQKYFFSQNNIQTRILADGDKIVIATNYQQNYGGPTSTGLFQLDAASGAILHQQWFNQWINFNHISRYSNGYIFDSNFPYPGNAGFYLRTDKSLNVISAKLFPSVNSFYFTETYNFQAQDDGSIYGVYTQSNKMSVFLMSPSDVLEWASGANTFYQNQKTLITDPSGVYMGTDYAATNVITGGPISGIQLYKVSSSGYFPACANPVAASIYPSDFSMIPLSPISAIRDTTMFSVADYTVQQEAGPTLTSNICQDLPTCTSLKITGNPNVCTGTGSFTAATNSGCSLPVAWSVTGGPGAGTIQSPGSSTTGVSFTQDGTYQLKAVISTNCVIFSDSLVLHVSTAPHLSLGDDTTLCMGDSLRLHPGGNFSAYTWQDGSTDSTFLVKTQGQYTVTAKDYCGNILTTGIIVSFLQPAASPFPNSVTKCPADTLSLAFPTGFDSISFLQTPGNARLLKDSVQFFNPDAASFVLREKDANGCVVQSPINVQVYNMPPLHIGNDTTVCPGDSVKLDAGANFTTYSWNTGDQSQTIWAARKGLYWVKTAANGCYVRDSMTLSFYPAPVVNLDPDTALCKGTTRVLSAGDGFTGYLWTDGSTASTLTVSTIGSYWVQVTDGNGCKAFDTVVIRQIVPVPADFLPEDTTLCQYGSLTLSPKGTFSTYQWSDGSVAPSLTVHSPGLYSLQVVDKHGCVGDDSIFLTGKQCLVGFYMPNAFTPNGDGENDVLRPLVYGNVAQYKFTVYNRWGQLIFESAELMKGWDGRVGGSAQPAGAFVWTCMYQFQGEQVHVAQGTVLLVR